MSPALPKPLRTTLLPALASAVAMPSPIPLVDPVMIDVLPASGRSCGAFAGRGEKRELAHGEHFSTNIDERAIHNAGGVVKDAQMDDFAREPVAVGAAIGRADAAEYQQPWADRRDC